MKNRTYRYDGPVMIFGKCVLRNWRTTTWAPSEKKALSNLRYRYAKNQGLLANAVGCIELPGKLKRIEWEEE